MSAQVNELATVPGEMAGPQMLSVTGQPAYVINMILFALRMRPGGRELFPSSSMFEVIAVMGILPSMTSLDHQEIIPGCHEEIVLRDLCRIQA